MIAGSMMFLGGTRAFVFWRHVLRDRCLETRVSEQTVARRAWGEVAPPVPTTRAERAPSEPDETTDDTEAPITAGAMLLNRKPVRRVYRSSVVR